jgi:hypothetical protein
MNSIDEASSAIISAAFSSPGTPNTRVTPSFSRHFTNSPAAFKNVSPNSIHEEIARSHANTRLRLYLQKFAIVFPDVM